MRLLDLTGDGHADLVVTETDVFTWYPSQARDGFGDPERVRWALDEDDGPRVLFSDRTEQIFIADMTGDGLADLVRIRRGSVCYWPNRGHGRFGARVALSGAPLFDPPDRFDPARIRLADVDGSGPTDLLYVGPEGVRIWFNESGNSLSTETHLTRFPSVASPNDVQVADLYGDGTACLVWSSPLLRDGVRPSRAVRLMSVGKPWLLTGLDNGLGGSTALTYTPSTHFYVADRQAGTPWATRLPFPVQCLSKVETQDSVTGWRFVTEYAYHDGTFDGPEREFRGFGLVEQWDTETATDLSVPPVRTRTWFHTGVWEVQDFSAEYFSAGSLTASELPAGLPPTEERQAHRALRGKPLRQEVYAEDGAGNLDVLYSVTESRWSVVRLQPGDGARPASFRVDSAETLSSAHELDLASGTPDPRVSHTLTLAVDDYGTVLRSAAIGYPRSSGDPEQTALQVVVSELEVIHDDTTTDRLHLAVPARSRTWELTNSYTWSLATAAQVDAAFSSDPKTLLGDQVTLYWDDALTGPLALGSLGERALPYERYALAFTSALVTSLFGTRVTTTELTEGGYVDLLSDGDSWIPSGRLTLDPAGFYQPTGHTDPFANPSVLTWDADFLTLTDVQDPAGLTVSAVIDYQLLVPSTLTDPNGTETDATFDPLGRVLTTAVRNGTDGDATGASSADFTYDTTTLPASIHTRLLKEHGGTDWQETWVYSDGRGNVVQTKVQAAPGDAPTVSGGVVTWAHSDPRFVGTGRTVLDNKGNIIRQYEPFFSTTSAYEDEDELVEWGVSAVFTYDPVGRNTEVVLPDGNVRSWSYGPWQVSASDEEDNLSGGDHEGTPTVTDLDVLGRVYQQTVSPDGTTDHTTALELDVVGNVLTVTDPRGNDRRGLHPHQRQGREPGPPRCLRPAHPHLALRVPGHPPDLRRPATACRSLRRRRRRRAPGRAHLLRRLPDRRPQPHPRSPPPRLRHRRPDHPGLRLPRTHHRPEPAGLHRHHRPARLDRPRGPDLAVQRGVLGQHPRWPGDRDLHRLHPLRRPGPRHRADRPGQVQDRARLRRRRCPGLGPGPPAGRFTGHQRRHRHHLQRQGSAGLDLLRQPHQHHLHPRPEPVLADRAGDLPGRRLLTWCCHPPGPRLHPGRRRQHHAAHRRCPGDPLLRQHPGLPHPRLHLRQPLPPHPGHRPGEDRAGTVRRHRPRPGGHPRPGKPGPASLHPVLRLRRRRQHHRDEAPEWCWHRALAPWLRHRLAATWARRSRVYRSSTA